MRKFLSWIRWNSTYAIHCIVYLPYLFLSYTGFLLSIWLDSVIAKRASNKFFHSYYKIYSWFSPNSRPVRQYNFGCSWLDYLTGKSSVKPKYYSNYDSEASEFSYSFVPQEMHRYCSLSGNTPIDLVSMQVIVRGLANNVPVKKISVLSRSYNS